MKTGGRNKRTRILAFGGILLALAVITLYIQSVTPVNKLSLYVLSSFYIAVLVIEAGTGAGWTFYAASVLLAFALVPDKIGLLPYLVFFGNYGLIKNYIERLHHLAGEFILKLLYFNAALGIAYWLASEFLLAQVTWKLPWGILIAGLEILFLVYDYVYTLFVQYYSQKIRSRLPS